MIRVDFVRKVTFVKNIKECGRVRISEARASLGENSQCKGTEVTASPEHSGSSWYGRSAVVVGWVQRSLLRD